MTILFKEVFTDLERSLLFKAIADELSRRAGEVVDGSVDSEIRNEGVYKIYPKIGRLTMEGLSLPSQILDKVKQVVASATGKTMTLLSTVYCEYSNIHGGPVALGLHKDGDFGHDTFLFDYQLDANVVWPLVVEDETFSLQNNQAIAFKTISRLHGRVSHKFEDGDFVKMVFVFFSPGSM